MGAFKILSTSKFFVLFFFCSNNKIFTATNRFTKTQFLLLPPNSGPLVRIGAARRLVAGGSDLLWVGPLAKQSDYSNILNVSFLSKKKASNFSTKEHRGIGILIQNRKRAEFGFLDNFELRTDRILLGFKLWSALKQKPKISDLFQCWIEKSS